MPQLGCQAGFAVKTLAIGLTRQEAGVRKLQGDDPVQLHVPRPPDRAEGAQADALEQLELAQWPHEFCRGGLPRVPKPEGTAAGRAEHFLMGLVLSQVERILAVRAEEAQR